MSQLVATARNLRFFHTDEGLAPEIEIVLTASEVIREYVGGNIQRVERLQTIRLTAGPAGARQLADSLHEWADEAERELARVEVKETEG